MCKNNKFIENGKKIHGDVYSYVYDIFKTVDTKFKIFCMRCDGFFEQTPYHHINRKQGCPTCNGNNRYDTKTFVEMCEKVHGNAYDYSDVKYVNSKTKIKIICKKCEKTFEQTPNNHLSGRKCFNCYGSKKYNNDMFVEKASIVHDNRYDYSNVILNGVKNKVEIICKKCNFIFEQTVDSHLNGHGCPKCVISKGEYIIFKYLRDNEIYFKYQHRFEKCINKKKLVFDFFLPDNNMCIEYDGIQHEKPILFFGKNKFEYYKNNDRIKNDFCLENKIFLLRITYQDKIESKLSEYF